MRNFCEINSKTIPPGAWTQYKPLSRIISLWDQARCRAVRVIAQSYSGQMDRQVHSLVLPNNIDTLFLMSL